MHSKLLINSSPPPGFAFESPQREFCPMPTFFNTLRVKEFFFVGVLDNLKHFCSIEPTCSTNKPPANLFQNFPTNVVTLSLIFQLPNMICQFTFFPVFYIVNVLFVDCKPILEGSGTQSNVAFHFIFIQIPYLCFINDVFC